MKTKMSIIYRKEKRNKAQKLYCIKYPEKRKETVKKSYKKLRKYNTEKYLFQQIKQRARRRRLEFSLNIEDIKIPKFCPVLGIKLKLNSNNKEGAWPSIDRIDNTKGYIKGNICIISHRANTIKSNATVKEVEKILNYMKESY